jgi:FG-GAP-like repeat
LTPEHQQVGDSPESVAIGDLNGDGKTDFAVASLTCGCVSILLGNGNGTLQSAVSAGTSGSAISVAVGDFNGDGISDLVTTNYVTNDISVLLGMSPAKATASGNGFSTAASLTPSPYAKASNPPHQNVLVEFTYQFQEGGKLLLEAINEANGMPSKMTFRSGKAWDAQ